VAQIISQSNFVNRWKQAKAANATSSTSAHILCNDTEKPSKYQTENGLADKASEILVYCLEM
jgi:hypothetical protein